MQPVVVHGLSVCLLVMTMSSAKMAELIGIGTWGPRNYLEACITHRNGHFCGSYLGMHGLTLQVCFIFILNIQIKLIGSTLCANARERTNIG